MGSTPTLGTKSMRFFIPVFVFLLACSQTRPPDTPEELYRQAMKKLEGGIFTADPETAEEYFRKIIENFPTSKYIPDAYLGIALVKLKKGNHAEACPLLENFYQRYPSHPKAQEALYLAIKCYTRFVDTPDRDITYAIKVRELSKVFLENFENEEVEKIRENVLNIIAQHHLEIAEFYIRRRVFQPAIDRLNQILQDEELRKTKYGKYAKELKEKIAKK